MEVTAEQLKLIKLHAKVDHSAEDELLKEYYMWAVNDIVDSVTGDVEPDMEFIEGQPLFRAAVLPLTAHYFENRLAFTPDGKKETDRYLTYAPHMVLSVVHKLRFKYERHMEAVNRDEV